MQLLEAWATARLEALGVDGVFAPYIVGMLPSHGGDDEDLGDAKFNIHQVLMGWLSPEDEERAQEFVDELAKLADSPEQLTEAAMAMATETGGRGDAADRASAAAIMNGLVDINDVMAQDEELKASAPTFVPGALSRPKASAPTFVPGSLSFSKSSTFIPGSLSLSKFQTSPFPEFHPASTSSGSPEGAIDHWATATATSPPPMHQNGHMDGEYDLDGSRNGMTQEDDFSSEEEREDGATMQDEDSFFWSVAYELVSHLQLKFPDIDPIRLCDLLRLVGLDVDKAHAVLKATLERESIGPGQVCRHYLQGECRRADCMFLHDTDTITCRFWLRGTCLQAEHCVFAHDFCEFYALDDSALAQRDYDSEDELDENGQTLDFQAEDMFPSLQSAAGGSPAPKAVSPASSTSLPSSGTGATTSATSTLNQYASTQDAVESLSMNFARAVALQPAPVALQASSSGNGGWDAASRRLEPSSAPHRPLYHKAGSDNTPNKWVETGESVASQYLELREQAYQMACARNKCFMGATQAYRNNNKALAKGLSKQGHEYNAKMKNLHFLAASEIFEARNPPSQLYMERLMDLHGLHVAEAVEFLAQMLPKLGDEGVDNIYLVTGSGHHSKGATGNARLLPAVQRFLASEGYQFSAVADSRGFVGMLLVDLRW